MLHLRKLGLLHEDVLTVTGETLGDNLDWGGKSERRIQCKNRLVEIDGINSDEAIMSPNKWYFLLFLCWNVS